MELAVEVEPTRLQHPIAMPMWRYGREMLGELPAI